MLDNRKCLYSLAVLTTAFVYSSAQSSTTTAGTTVSGATTVPAGPTTTTTMMEVTVWAGYDDKCYCPGDDIFLLKEDLFLEMTKHKHSADKGDFPDVVDPLAVFRRPVARLPGIPPLSTLQIMFPDQTDEELRTLTQQILLDRLDIKTTLAPTTTTTALPTTTAVPTTAGPTAAGSTTAASGGSTTTAAAASGGSTTAAVATSTAATSTTVARRKRDIKEQLNKLVERAKRQAEAEGATESLDAPPEGIDMLIPRKNMTGIWPQGDTPREDHENSIICLCPEPGMRFRKAVTLNPSTWKPPLVDPSSQTFMRSKGSSEETLMRMLMESKILLSAGISGITILSMELEETETQKMSDVLDDAIVHLEVEITFAMEYNETIKMELDEVFTKNQGLTTTAEPSSNATCNFEDLPEFFGDENHLTRLDVPDKYLITTNQVGSGLFAYFKCTESLKFLSSKFDPDKDGTMGIQCKGNDWDTEGTLMPTVEECVEETVCSVDSLSSKISGNKFLTPKLTRVATQEFLFLTCEDPESYLFSSREPLPAIFKLICQADGTFLPWTTDSSGNQGPDPADSWPSCKTPKYCTTFPESPDIPVTTTTTTTTQATTTSDTGSTQTPRPTRPPPTSKLIPANSVTKVREYDFYEYKCEDLDMVADTASTFKLECPKTGVFPLSGAISWPVCRPSVKCRGDIPVPPFYTGLFSRTTPPLKEYDQILFTCYDSTLKPDDGSKGATVECGSDGNYILPALWPICQVEGTKACHCLGDPDVTSPAKCSIGLSECPAAKILDSVCRNNTKIMLYNDDMPLVPLKDRCGVTDIGKPTKENMCYCGQKTEEGVKDAYDVVFHIISELWENEMGFAATEKFKSLKLKIEKNFDDLLLSEETFVKNQYVATKVRLVEKGPGMKCRIPPTPPSDSGYIAITSATADISVGDFFIFQCERSLYLESLNSTDPFGIECKANKVDARGYYAAPKNLSLWERCVPDPSYIPGCKKFSWPTPKGDLILGTNPDNILIGDTLKFICPELGNPPSDRPNQRGVTSFGDVFELACLEGENLQTAMFWPPCQPPRLCLAQDGPATDEDTTGLSGSYEDKYEFETHSLSCSDTIKEVPETITFTIGCGYNTNKTATNGVWEKPENWPLCVYVDAESCDPSTEIDIPESTGLMPSSQQFVLKGSKGELKCKNTSLVIKFSAEDKPSALTTEITCDENGKFNMTDDEWPYCEWPSCSRSSLPPSNETGDLYPVDGNDTLMEDYQKYKCFGDNVTDSGIYVLMACKANADGSGANFDTAIGWPQCRAPNTCTANAFPQPPSEATATGLACPVNDTSEFYSVDCTCPEGTRIDSNLMPRCAKDGIWEPPATWPVCVEVTTTTVATTTVEATTAAATVAAASTVAGTTSAGGTTVAGATTVAGSTLDTTTTVAGTTTAARRKRSAPIRLAAAFDEHLGYYVPVEDLPFSRQKRQASKTTDYIRVYGEMQFAIPANESSLSSSIVQELMKNITKTRNGILREEGDPLYMKIEMPPAGLTSCRDCIKVANPLTCENDLLSLMKTGYKHNKPSDLRDDSKGGLKDVYEVMVGATVEIYCSDFWKKPKKDSWDDDRKDGLLTATCLYNRKFSVPYDTTSWGSCLAKCPALKPETDETPIPDTRLTISSAQMLGNEFTELWEGEELAYACDNRSLVLNNDPDLAYRKYLCKTDGSYDVPKGIALGDPWPVCTTKPVRPQIKEAIRLMTAKFDRNIQYRNALYGGIDKEDMKAESELMSMFFAITFPASLAFIALVVLLCCCSRPDSVLCKICEPTVTEKPTGKSAVRRSARSARMSARSSAPTDPEDPPIVEEMQAPETDIENPETPENEDQIQQENEELLNTEEGDEGVEEGDEEGEEGGGEEEEEGEEEGEEEEGEEGEEEGEEE